MPLQTEFDPAKEATNLRVHGVSLAQAEALLEGFTVLQQDERFNYGETRIIAIGEIAGVEFSCVYTRRGEALNSRDQFQNRPLAENALL